MYSAIVFIVRNIWTGRTRLQNVENEQKFKVVRDGFEQKLPEVSEI